MDNLNNDNLIDSLRSKKVTPDKAWQESAYKNLEAFVKKDVTNTNNKSIFGVVLLQISNLFNIFKIQNNKKLFLGLSATFSLVLLAGTTLGGFIIYSNRDSRNDNYEISAAESRAILEKVLQNNSKTALKSQSYNATADLSSESIQADAKIALAYPATEGDYSYYHYITESKSGPASDKCDSMSYFSSSVPINKWESYNFYQNDSYYSKNLSYTDSGQVIYYNLNETTKNTSSYTDYMGGKYAIKSSYVFHEDQAEAKEVIVDSEPETFPELNDIATEIDPIKNYFGEDATVVGEETINGKVHYIIQYSYKTNCDATNIDVDYTYSSEISDVSPDFEENDKITEKLWVEKDTFEISRSETYLNGTKEENRIVTNENTNERKNVEFSEVSDMFKFDYNVEIKEYSYDDNYDPNKDIRDAIKYYEENTVNTLVVNNSELKPDYLSIEALYNAPTELSPYEDRAFYPDGKLGDDLFEEANSYKGEEYEYYNADIYLGYLGRKNLDSYVSISSFSNSEATKDKLVNQMVGDIDSIKNTSKVTIVVDGENVSADLYTIEWEMSEPMYIEEGSGEEGKSSPSEPGGFEVYTDQYLVFEVDDSIYFVTLSGSDALSYDKYKFEILDSSNVQDLAQLKDLLEKLIVK